MGRWGSGGESGKSWEDECVQKTLYKIIKERIKLIKRSNVQLTIKLLQVDKIE